MGRISIGSSSENRNCQGVHAVILRMSPDEPLFLAARQPRPRNERPQMWLLPSGNIWESGMTRTWMGLIGCASLALAASAFALEGSQAAPKEQHGGAGKGGPGAGKAKHQHHHNNGHMLLGAKLKQDGKHA